MTGNLDKDLTLIVSGGRTGTTFLGETISSMIPDAHSVHEPDVWPGVNLEALRRIREFGLRHMVIDRLRGKTGFRNLSIKRLRGTLSLDAAAAEIRRQRVPYYRSRDGSLVVESNYQAFGVLPAFLRAFPDAKIAGLVRHPATWVTSQLDYGKRRGYRDRVEAWGRSRLTPESIGDVEFQEEWAEMGPVQRLCWDWLVINRTLASAAEDSASVRIFRYEDLFLSEARESNFRRLLDYLTDHPGRRYEYSLSQSLLDQRINPRPDREMSSRERGEELRDQVREICGDLMTRFGYVGGQSP